MVAESHDHGQSPQQNEAGNRHCYDAVGSVEKPAFSRRRLRLWGVAVLVAVAGAVCLMGLARERQVGAATDALLESNTAAPHGREAGQETRDRARVEALKAKLAKAEGMGKVGTNAAAATSRLRASGKQGPLSPRAAAAAGNRNSKALRKSALRDVWLSAALPEAAQKKAASSRRIKTVKTATILKEFVKSMQAQQQAVSAALELLEDKEEKASEGKADADADGKEVVLDIEGRRGHDEGGNEKETREEDGGRGRNATGGGDEATATSSVNCSMLAATNETACIPLACNVTEANERWNTSLPACVAPLPEQATNSSLNVTARAEEPAEVNREHATPAPPAIWNRPENTAEAGVNSGAAGVVAGDVWVAGSLARPEHDTIYCYDDAADGGFTRHARRASICWYRRAYCELYCEGDIMSTPAPVPMDSPAVAAYGQREVRGRRLDGWVLLRGQGLGDQRSGLGLGFGGLCATQDSGVDIMERCHGWV
jgi:hypothetical protein